MNPARARSRIAPLQPTINAPQALITNLKNGHSMRYPPVAPQDMNHEQRRVAQAVAKRRKPSVSSEGGVEGPFIPLVHVPGILDHLQFLGEHCRFHTSVPPKLRELAIIITARHMAAPLEFHVHAMEAHEFGLADEAIKAVADQRGPANLDEEEGLVYHFCSSLYTEGRVADELFDRCEKKFGKAMLIELLATCGYYAMLGMGMNVTQAPTPAFLAGFVPAFTVTSN
jgi:4-carboxymuconolactone decarboxylase